MEEHAKEMTLQELVASLPGDDLSNDIREKMSQVTEGFAEMSAEIKRLRKENQEIKAAKKNESGAAIATIESLKLDLVGAKSLAANREKALQGATEDYAELRKATELKLESFKSVVDELESRPREKEQVELKWVIWWLHEGNMMKRFAKDEDEAKNFYGLLGDRQKALTWTYAFQFDGLNDLLADSFVKSLERKVRLDMKALGISTNSDEVLIPDEVANLLQLAREELLENGSTSEVLHRIESMLIDEDEWEPAIVTERNITDDDLFEEDEEL